jgi:hypothetical protein
MKESRLWQAIGVACILGGAIVLTFVYMKRRMFAESTAYASLVGASFIVLAGLTGFIFGRIMHVMGGGDCKGNVWQGLGVLCILGGVGMLGYYGMQSWGYVPDEHQLVRGLAASFLLMAGIVALLGGRTINLAMSGGKAKAASA